MKFNIRLAILMSGLVASVHAAKGAPRPPAELVSAHVFQDAGIALNGEGFPGAPLSSWLEKPADHIVFLHGDWTELLGEVHRLGDVSVLSGNETVMHLATGQYDPFRGGEGHALVLNQGIDLRLFPGHWEYGAAVLAGSGQVPGFLFFNGAGEPVHRILLTESSDVAEFDAIVAAFKGERPEFSPWEEAVEPTEAATDETRADLLEDWRALTDTHAFGRLLHKYKISRTDALRIAEGEFTAQLEPETYASIFSQLVNQDVSIIFFALNNGCVQISTGALTEINQTRDTLQLVEQDSRTLIALPRIAEVWRVSKPTKQGMAYSLELYDAEGAPVAYIFGARKEDAANADVFQKILYGLPLAGDVVAAASSEVESSTCSKKSDCAKAPAASSEGEPSGCADTTTAAGADLVPAVVPVDTFNLPRRVRSQLNFTVKRLLEFDGNGDERLTESELPQRLKGLLATGNQNGDDFLDKDELTAMAYAQYQAREARANKESVEKH